MNKPSVLLISAEMTDERAWTSLSERLDDWEVAVVAWPLGLSADIVEATRDAVGTAVFDVVLTDRAGAAAVVDLASRGQAKALVMVEGDDFAAVHGKIDKIEGAVAAAKVFTENDLEPFMDAMTAGDTDRAAALMLETFAEGPATEHRPVLQSMLATYMASTGLSPHAAPVHHPWASWLAEVSTPVLLVRSEQAEEPGTYSARSVGAFARQCPTARIVSLPLAKEDPPGLTHPDELADLVRQMAVAADEVGTEVPVPSSPVPDGGDPTTPDDGADVDAAVAVINAYFSAQDDDEEAMELARAAADERDGRDVLDGLILLVVGLIAGRQGERGITPSESLEEQSRIIRAIRRYDLS